MMIVVNDNVDLQQLEEGMARKMLARGGELMLVEVHFAPGAGGAPHSHDTHEQAAYIAKGSFEVTLGETTKVLKQGDSFYAAQNVPHGVVALEESIIVDAFTPQREDFLRNS